LAYKTYDYLKFGTTGALGLQQSTFTANNISLRRNIKNSGEETPRFRIKHAKPLSAVISGTVQTTRQKSNRGTGPTYRSNRSITGVDPESGYSAVRG